MKRTLKSKSYTRWMQLLSNALPSVRLPEVFRSAVHLMVTRGFHPMILHDVHPKFKSIIFNPAFKETGYRAVYVGFSNIFRLEPFPDHIDWAKYGYNGGTSLIFPDETPELWVVLHELGHYIDDVYLSANPGWINTKFVCDHGINAPSPCSGEKISRFRLLRAGMELEFEQFHKRAWNSVSEETRKSRYWWQDIPLYLVDYAPSQYAFFSFSEWIAEAFQRYYTKDDYYLAGRCPATFEFMHYALSGQIFNSAALPAQDTDSWLTPVDPDSWLTPVKDEVVLDGVVESFTDLEIITRFYERRFECPPK